MKENQFHPMNRGITDEELIRENDCEYSPKKRITYEICGYSHDFTNFL